MNNELKTRLRHLKAELSGAILIAVSKYSPVEEVIEAYSYGQCDFGENRVLELKKKAEKFESLNFNNVCWHFIGALQTNKIKDLLKIPNLWAIHSVTSKKIVDEIIKRESEFKGIELKLFFQVKTTLEEEKSGFESFEELKESIDLVQGLENTKLKVFGLMTMGAIRTETFETSAIHSFRELKIIREKLGLKDLKLSMGMSQDYKIALLEGSDFIRVGSLLFKD
jgi:pyridoxal phosphate enzyme (YggS family)